MTVHAFERARRRYGVNITIDEMTELTRQCRSKEAPLLRRDGATEVRSVTYYGAKLKAVYDPLADEIVTFLAPEPRGDYFARKRVAERAHGYYAEERAGSNAKRRRSF